MNEYTKEVTEIIAQQLKLLMQEQGITAQDVINKSGLRKPQVYSVLKMGAFKNKDYTINTFFNVLRIINVHLDLTAYGDWSNSLPDGVKPNFEE